MSLNPQQLAVVQAPAAGTTKVSALAGTGKSTTLLARAETILTGNQKKLLLLAFNTRIADEMKVKVATQLRGLGPRRIMVQTSHSFALAMIKNNLHHLGAYIGTPDFEVLEKLKRIAKALIAIGNLSRSVSRDAFARLTRRYRKVLEILIKAGCNNVAALAEEIFLDRYWRGQLAFSDLLPLAVTLPNECFADAAGLLEAGAGAYEYLMVDEAQDLNELQHAIVCKLVTYAEGLTLVGDGYQSIYKFTGASPEVFNRAGQVYNATTYPLEYNYRSSPKILRFANTILRDMLGSRMQLRPGREDMDHYPDPWVLPQEKTPVIWVNEMRSLDIPLNEIAILHRTNDQALMLELQLLAAHVPYQTKSGGFLDLPVVKDMLAYVMMCLEFNDDWWKTIVGHRKFLGRETAQASYGLVMFEPDKRPWMSDPDTLRSAGMRSAWAELREDMEFYRDAVSRDVAGEFERIMFSIKNKLQDYWAEKYAADPDEYEDALTVAKAVLDWTSSMTSFQDLAQVLRSRKQTISDEGINLSTIHKSKGLEFDCVLIIECGSTTFVKESPNMEEDDMDEEFRLFYVGETRAKKYFTISCSAADPTGGMIGRHLRSAVYGAGPNDYYGDTERDPFYNPASHAQPAAVGNDFFTA